MRRKLVGWAARAGGRPGGRRGAAPPARRPPRTTFFGTGKNPLVLQWTSPRLQRWRAGGWRLQGKRLYENNHTFKMYSPACLFTHRPSLPLSCRSRSRRQRCAWLPPRRASPNLHPTFSTEKSVYGHYIQMTWTEESGCKPSPHNVLQIPHSCGPQVSPSPQN